MLKEDVIEIIKRIPSDKLDYFKIIFQDSNSEKKYIEFDDNY